MRRFFQIQLFALMTVIAFYAIYAYASSDRPSAGSEGTSSIGGWTISGVQYHLEKDSAKNSAVEFDLDGPANVVRVSVNSAGTSFFDCVNTNGTHWYCIIGPEIGISEFDQLKVIAS